MRAWPCLSPGVRRLMRSFHAAFLDEPNGPPVATASLSIPSNDRVCRRVKFLPHPLRALSLEGTQHQHEIWYLDGKCPLGIAGQRLLRREQVCRDRFTSWAVSEVH